MFRLFCAAGLLALTSCSPAPPPLYKVTGTVKWNGKAIENGRLNLLSTDGSSAPATAKIENGAFELRATAGAKRVEVFNQKGTGYDKAMGAQGYVNDIPPEYNGESKLTFEVRPTDDNVLELVLPQK